MRILPAWPNHLPKTQALMPSFLGLGFQHRNVGETWISGPRHLGTMAKSPLQWNGDWSWGWRAPEQLPACKHLPFPVPLPHPSPSSLFSLGDSFLSVLGEFFWVFLQRGGLGAVEMFTCCQRLQEAVLRFAKWKLHRFYGQFQRHTVSVKPCYGEKFWNSPFSREADLDPTTHWEECQRIFTHIFKLPQKTKVLHIKESWRYASVIVYLITYN